MKCISESTRSLSLTDAEDEGGKANDVTTTFASGEISPPAIIEVDAETAEMPIMPAGIQGNPFVSMPTPVRKPDSHQAGDVRGGDTVNGREIYIAFTGTVCDTTHTEMSSK